MTEKSEARAGVVNFGGCAGKAVDLSSEDLRCVRNPGLSAQQGA